jgi:hypothetical protein
VATDDLTARVEHDLRVATRRFRSRIARIAAFSIVLDLAVAGVALATEHGAGKAFATYWQALFWTTTQLLTVSSSLPNPQRALTKVLDVGLEAYAIVVVATLAGTFADLLHHRTRHHAAVARR